MPRLVLLLATCAFASTCLVAGAAPYKNDAFGYRIELPDGFQATSPASASVATFAQPAHEMTIKLAAASKPGPLGEGDAARYRSQDESSIKEKAGGYKQVPVTGADVTGKKAVHYGFIYKDKSGVVYVARFVLFCRSQGSSHTWVKGQSICPKTKYPAASKAFDRFLVAFRWVEPDAGPVPGEPPSPAVTQVVTPVTTPSAVASQPAQVAVPQSDYGDLFAKHAHGMSPTVKKMYKNRFTADGDRRTAEEMNRARMLGTGGVFKPSQSGGGQ